MFSKDSSDSFLGKPPFILDTSFAASILTCRSSLNCFSPWQ